MQENEGTWKEWSKYVLIELRRLNDNGDNMKAEISNLTHICDRNTTSVEHHIKRSDTFEDFVKEQEKRIAKLEETNKGWIFTGKVLVTSGGIIVTTIGLVATILGMMK